MTPPIERGSFGLLVSDSVLAMVIGHAVEAYPRECCGMILASGLVRRCENAIDRLNAADSATFPRNSSNGYALNLGDLRYLVDSFNSEDPVRIIYHSHPNADAGFSREDRRMAMPDGMPLYPELAHLIVSVANGEARDTLLFAFVSDDYREIASFKCTEACRLAHNR